MLNKEINHFYSKHHCHYDHHQYHGSHPQCQQQNYRRQQQQRCSVEKMNNHLNMFKFLNLIVILLILNCHINQVLSYSHGGPVRSCSTLLPNHGVDKQYGIAPYEIKTSIQPNGNVIVTIQSVNSQSPFAGFMLQARQFNEREKIVQGKFTEDKQSQIRNCNGDSQNTLTHRSATPKFKVETTFTPPKGFSGSIVFRATIVQSKSVYWTAQDSSPVQIGSPNQSSKYLKKAGQAFQEISPSNKVLNSYQTEPSSSLPQSVFRLDYNQCQSKLCFGLPEDCVEQNNCDYLLSATQNDEGNTEFEIQADVGTTSLGRNLNKYWSIGLSSDDKMGDDSVTDCVLNNGKVFVKNSINTGHKNEQLLLSEFHGVTPLNTSFINGIVHCKWRRLRRSTIRGQLYDLLTNQYHVLLATGQIDTSDPNANDDFTKVYHDERLASSNRVDLKQIGSIKGKSLLFLVRIHGSLMVIAWMGTISFGIIMARHYKQVWSDSTWCGVKIWFACHRALMLTSISLMLIAQICIYYFVGGFTFGVHQIIGLIAFILGVFQPFNALMRPHPTAKNRWIFNWIHWFIGNLAQILAITTIFLAYNLKQAQLPPAFLWLMMVYVLFHVSSHIILQVQVCVMQNKSKKTVDITMNDMRMNGGSSLAETDPPGSGFKRFFLGIYLVIIIGLVFGLIFCISLPFINQREEI